MKHGSYSKKQAERCGTCFWKTPDGGEVEISCVCDPEKCGCKWDDKIDLGPVTEWSRGQCVPQVSYG